MSTALATRQLTADAWGMIQAVAPVMKDARLFGVATEAQAAAIMAKGFELGLSLTASFEFITVIENKPALIPRGALALILNSPLLDGLVINDEVDGNSAPVACSVTMKRKNGFEYKARYTMEDAKRAGLVKPGSGWEKYPSNMLRWRCLGFCADVVFPDVIGGLKRADELGADLTPDGEVIEGSWSRMDGSQPAQRVAAAQIADAQPAQVDPVAWLNQLAQQYGAEAIITANEGKIPGTVEELGMVEAKLVNGAGK